MRYISVSMQDTFISCTLIYRFSLSTMHSAIMQENITQGQRLKVGL